MAHFTSPFQDVSKLDLAQFVCLEFSKKLTVAPDKFAALIEVEANLRCLDNVRNSQVSVDGDDQVPRQASSTLI